jgi:hypothetical protein
LGWDWLCWGGLEAACWCCSFCSKVAEFKIFPVLNALFLGRFGNDIGMQVGLSRHHGFQLVSIACRFRSAAAARRDSSDDGPSSQSNQRGFRKSLEEGLRWREANRSLWPNSEVHEESLPAMPVLFLIRVQNKNTTNEVRCAMGYLQRTLTTYSPQLAIYAGTFLCVYLSTQYLNWSLGGNQFNQSFADSCLG